MPVGPTALEKFIFFLITGLDNVFIKTYFEPADIKSPLFLLLVKLETVPYFHNWPFRFSVCLGFGVFFSQEAGLLLLHLLLLEESCPMVSCWPGPSSPHSAADSPAWPCTGHWRYVHIAAGRCDHRKGSTWASSAQVSTWKPQCSALG